MRACGQSSNANPNAVSKRIPSAEAAGAAVPASPTHANDSTPKLSGRLLVTAGRSSGSSPLAMAGIPAATACHTMAAARKSTRPTPAVAARSSCSDEAGARRVRVNGRQPERTCVLCCHGFQPRPRPRPALPRACAAGRKAEQSPPPPADTSHNGRRRRSTIRARRPAAAAAAQ